MLVISKSEKSIKIPIEIHTANTFTKRLIGLMFKRRPIVNKGLHIVPCNSIHMFFMSFSIDVIFLNSNNKIVFLVQELKPWKVTPIVKNAKSVIELPAGTIKKYGIELDDLILI